MYSANIYLLKVNNGNVRKVCQICSKLAIKTPERRQWRRSTVFVFNLEHISNLYLLFVLLNLSTLMFATYVASSSTIPVKFFRNVTFYCCITCQVIFSFSCEHFISKSWRNPRWVFRTLSDIQDRAFCENSERQHNDNIKQLTMFAKSSNLRFFFF